MFLKTIESGLKIYMNGLKTMNESLDRYCKNILKEEAEIFHNDNGEDYEIVERSKSGFNCLLKLPNGKQWIIAWNCPSNNRGSWGQGHYFFDEESAREVWEDKYKNESLQEDLATFDNQIDLNYDVYGSLRMIMEKWEKYGATEHDLDKAYEWFTVHYFDFVDRD